MFERFMSDSYVKKKYVKAGAIFGGSVSDVSLGGVDFFFDILLDKWGRWEAEYAKRGYRTLSLDDFIGYGGGYGLELKDLGIKRIEGEKPILHAEIYRQEYQRMFDLQ